MPTGHIFYLLLLATSLIVSIWCQKNDFGLRIFPYLLGIALGIELMVDTLHYAFHQKHNWLFHIYVPIEYVLLSYYFYTHARNKTFSRIILASMPLYLVLSFWLSWKFVLVDNYPGINFNVEGVLLIAWSISTLFLIEVNPHVSLLRLPVFWICIAVLIFYSGLFFMNFIYDYLNNKHHELAKELNQLVIKNLNYLLYILFIVAFLCSNRMTKSTLP